jgi:hypothetical protein
MRNFQTNSFCICDGKSFNGITNNDRWNGWQTPWFALSEIQAIQEWFEDGINQNDIIIEGDKVFVFYHFLEERFECEKIQHEGVTYHYLEGLCWEFAQ